MSVDALKEFMLFYGEKLAISSVVYWDMLTLPFHVQSKSRRRTSIFVKPHNEAWRLAFTRKAFFTLVTRMACAYTGRHHTAYLS